MDGGTTPERAPISRATTTGRTLTLDRGPRAAIRERADRSLRAHLRAGVRRLPSDRWEALMKRRVRPAGVLPELLADAARDPQANLDALEELCVSGVRQVFAAIRAERDTAA